MLPTSCQYGFLLSFSPLEYGKIGKSGGAGIDKGAGIRLPTSYLLVFFVFVRHDLTRRFWILFKCRYHFFDKVSEEAMVANLQVLQENKAHIPIDMVQLDDGYPVSLPPTVTPLLDCDSKALVTPDLRLFIHGHQRWALVTGISDPKCAL